MTTDAHPNEELLHLYFDAEGNPELRSDIEEHLQSCPECLARLAELGDLSRELRELPDLEAPPLLFERVQEAIRTPERTSEHGPPTLAWFGRWAAVFLIALTAGLVLWIEFGDDARRLARREPVAEEATRPAPSDLAERATFRQPAAEGARNGSPPPAEERDADAEAGRVGGAEDLAAGAAEEYDDGSRGKKELAKRAREREARTPGESAVEIPMDTKSRDRPAGDVLRAQRDREETTYGTTIADELDDGEAHGATRASTPNTLYYYADPADSSAPPAAVLIAVPVARASDLGELERALLRWAQKGAAPSPKLFAGAELLTPEQVDARPTRGAFDVGLPWERVEKLILALRFGALGAASGAEQRALFPPEEDPVANDDTGAVMTRIRVLLVVEE